ncbi:bifunctional hydroxymethylpyrimidine kinase/phosphomethylpyrimidine kinase [bacterium]|nr:bifunctional hydroxymethylpyrimidine kinase/phosphomethylpyrimidine kinase [bacterium]
MNALDQAVDKLKGAHILVAGEVGIDEYIWGDTRRISPEAPVPVVEVESQSYNLGLAANVAQNIVSLGAQTTLVSVCGMDSDGEKLQKMIADAGIRKSVFIGDPSRPTLRKVRVIAQKQHVVRVDYERCHVLDAKLAKQFTESICDLLPSSDGVIVQDYGKGLWNADTMSFVRQARDHRKPVFVDPSQSTPLTLYKGVTLLTPNVAEAETLTGFRHEPSKIAGRDDERLTRMAKRILEKTECEHALITCGAAGMITLGKNESALQRIPTFAREVFDVTGAGDTVVSVLAMAMVCEMPLAECMRLANAAAGIVVGKIGTASVTPEELRAELKRLADLGLIS